MAINKSKLVAIIVKTTTFKSLYANLKDKGKDKELCKLVNARQRSTRDIN